MLVVRNIVLDGPYNPPAAVLPEIHQRIMAHTPDLPPREAAREIVARFADRAFRRPVKPEEVERLLSSTTRPRRRASGSRTASALALEGVLVSPHFLFRVELDPPGVKPGTSYPINEYELACRLSYFLWSSMPDDELFALAAQGQLRRNLDAQVRRMLEDPKSAAFVQNFAGQWLTTPEARPTSPPTPRTFPGFDEELRAAMVRETELFFEAILREDRSILDLLDADFSFVNERLAKHYGIDGVTGPEFRRVKLPPNRGGILTQASILTLTSNPTRTSPVKRGKWVLDQILDTPPPPPPPDVPELPDDEAADRLAPQGDGAAPRERALRLLPPADGPDRLRLRELRRRRRLARQGRRVRHRPLGRAAGRPVVPGAGRAEGDPQGQEGLCSAAV